MENLILVLSLIIMFAQCDQPKDRVQLGPENSGQEVEIPIQVDIEISLVANPGTGYSWSVEQTDSAKLIQIGESTFEAGSEQLGAPGQQIFHLRPKSAGTVRLKLIYHRPWEKVGVPADSFEVTLHIIDGK